MKESNEIWKDVLGFPMYEVSNLGRVRSWKKKGGGPHRADYPRVLKPCMHGEGKKAYPAVNLYNGKKYRLRLIHRLVLESFEGPRPEGMVSRHLNGNPKDNRVENLRWGTQQENALDRHLHGTMNAGGRLVKKLSDEEVVDIYARHLLGETITEIYADYPQVTRRHMEYVVKGQARKKTIKAWLESQKIERGAV